MKNPKFDKIIAKKNMIYKCELLMNKLEEEVG